MPTRDEIEAALKCDENAKSWMLRRIADALPDSDWQPIDTSPHTGIAVLIWQPWERGRESLVIGHYADGWIDRDCKYLLSEPTHWMPLPAPPEQAP